MTQNKKVIFIIIIIFFGILTFQSFFGYDESLQKEIIKCLEKEKSSSRENCLRLIAVREKDETICDELIEKSPSNSNSFTPAARDRCYWKVAYEKKDSSICKTIITPNINSVCLRQTEFIEKFKDSSYCENLEDIEKRNNCYVKYAEINEDCSVCSKINQEGNGDFCYHRAVLFGASEYCCDEITSKNERIDCKENSQVTLTSSFWRNRIIEEILILLGLIGILFFSWSKIKFKLREAPLVYKTILISFFPWAIYLFLLLSAHLFPRPAFFYFPSIILFFIPFFGSLAVGLVNTAFYGGLNLFTFLIFGLICPCVSIPISVYLSIRIYQFKKEKSWKWLLIIPLLILGLFINFLIYSLQLS